MLSKTAYRVLHKDVSRDRRADMPLIVLPPLSSLHFNDLARYHGLSRRGSTSRSVQDGGIGRRRLSCCALASCYLGGNIARFALILVLLVIVELALDVLVHLVGSLAEAGTDQRGSSRESTVQTHNGRRPSTR